MDVKELKPSHHQLQEGRVGISTITPFAMETAKRYLSKQKAEDGHKEYLLKFTCGFLGIFATLCLFFLIMLAYRNVQLESDNSQLAANVRQLSILLNAAMMQSEIDHSTMLIGQKQREIERQAQELKTWILSPENIPLEMLNNDWLSVDEEPEESEHEISHLKNPQYKIQLRDFDQDEWKEVKPSDLEDKEKQEKKDDAPIPLPKINKRPPFNFDDYENGESEDGESRFDNIFNFDGEVAKENNGEDGVLRNIFDAINERKSKTQSSEDDDDESAEEEAEEAPPQEPAEDTFEIKTFPPSANDNQNEAPLENKQIAEVQMEVFPQFPPSANDKKDEYVEDVKQAENPLPIIPPILQFPEI